MRTRYELAVDCFLAVGVLCGIAQIGATSATAAAQAAFVAWTAFMLGRPWR